MMVIGEEEGEGYPYAAPDHERGSARMYGALERGKL